MKNDTDHVLDELSAYLDGEADDMARVARHIQHCEACAKRHIELLRLSNHLRHLPEPAVSPDFTARVIMRVEEDHPRAWRTAFRPVRLAALALAACLIAMAAVVFQNRFASAPATSSPATAMSNPQLAALEMETTDFEWLNAIEGELTAFGGDDFDDFVDSAIMATDETSAAPENGDLTFFPEDMEEVFDEALQEYVSQEG